MRYQENWCQFFYLHSVRNQPPKIKLFRKIIFLILTQFDPAIFNSCVQFWPFFCKLGTRMFPVETLKISKIKNYWLVNYCTFYTALSLTIDNATVKVLHYRRGYVAMSNSGEPDTNASQAVVLFCTLPLIPFE